MSAAASRWARLRSWLRAATHRGGLETEIEAEIRFHLEARATDLEAGGMTPQQATRQARLEFGGPAMHKDGMRDALGLRWWDELWADLRYALRLLAKTPGFTLIAVASLALALGANTTIFSVADALLYARLGVPHPKQLRLLLLSGDKNLAVHSMWGNFDTGADGQIYFDSFSYPAYRQLRGQNRVTEDIFAFKDLNSANVTVHGIAQAAHLELVSGNFYTQMGVRPQLGRPIEPADDSAPGAGAVATISDGFWARAFGRSPAAVGSTIQVNATPVTIVGVNPPGFTGAQSAQSSPALFMPLSMITVLRAAPPSGTYLSTPEMWWLQLMARTKPGVAPAQAEAGLNQALAAAVHATMSPKAEETMPRLRLDDGSKGLNEAANQFAKPLYVLLGMVGLVLLLACVNLANLLLARAAARRREMGVRLALGASRMRVLRQVLTECLLLAAAGGVLGLLLGYLCRSLLPRLLSPDGDYTVSFDWRVLAFTAVLTVGTGLLFGLAPAWAATRSEIGTALKDGDKSVTRRRRGWSGKMIVSLQIALSTLLVAGSVLFLRTVINLRSLDPGFRPGHLLLLDVNAPTLGYPSPKDVILMARIEDAVRALPGVSAVSLTDNPLVANSESISGFMVEGRPEVHAERGDMSQSSNLADVGPDFLKAMGIPLIAGRTFSAADLHASERVAIVNQALAKRFFPGQNPVGQRFTKSVTRDGPHEATRHWIRIIGICGDTRYQNLKDAPPPLHFDLYSGLDQLNGATFAVRTPLQPAAIVPSIRAAVQKIDSNLPLLQVRTQEEQIRETMQTELTFSTLSAGFGLMALALASVGIYGIMAYTVSQRRSEIGIRLALGAARRQVRGIVLREAAWLTLAGVLVGLGAALALGRLVKSLLYGLAPADALSLSTAALMLAAVALLAAWMPAWRASRVEPMEALRHE